MIPRPAHSLPSCRSPSLLGAPERTPGFGNPKSTLAPPSAPGEGGPLVSAEPCLWARVRWLRQGTPGERGESSVRAGPLARQATGMKTTVGAAGRMGLALPSPLPLLSSPPSGELWALRSEMWTSSEQRGEEGRKEEQQRKETLGHVGLWAGNGLWPPGTRDRRVWVIGEGRGS